MAEGLTIIVKKFIIDLFTDPEKIVNFIVYWIIVPILAIVLLFAAPIFFVVSTPLLLIDGSNNQELSAEQIKVIYIYQNAPIQENKKAMEWVEKTKKEYSWCDDIVVNYNFDLTWQSLMALDAVKLKQDFNKADESDISELAKQFISKNVKVESYTVIEDDKVIVKKRAVITVKTKPFSEMVNKMGFTEFEKQVANNIYNNILYADVEGNFNIYDDINLSDLQEYPPGNAKIPYFHQADKRWGNYSYGSSTIKSGGCGPTSLAMVVSGLKKRGDVNPKSVADWSIDNGHRADGAGSYWSLMIEGGINYGLKVEAVSRKNPKRIVEALSQGHPIIVSMGPGHFTRAGHFIVLRGITKDGKILVNDPASVARTEQEWDLSIILNESSINGGVNGSSFWIYTTK